MAWAIHNVLVNTTAIRPLATHFNSSELMQEPGGLEVAQLKRGAPGTYPEL